jgi:hypothetical protein
MACYQPEKLDGMDGEGKVRMMRMYVSPVYED